MSVKCLRRAVLGGLLSVVLVACGGGGGESEPPPAQPQLSQTQALFDEATLASHGGAYQVVASHRIDPDGPKLLWATTYAVSMNRSPSQRPAEGATATPAAPELLVQPVPGTPFLDFSNRAGQAVVAEGGIHFIRNNARTTVRHDGDDVLLETQSTDGVYTRRERITSVTRQELRGRLAAAPAEFRAAYATLVAELRPGVPFPDGAAYYKRTSVRVGELLSLVDGDFNSATDPQSATPFMAGTVEGVLGLLGVDQRDGSIRTVNGARCWVRRAANETLQGFPMIASVTPSHSVACEIAGKVYLGNLQPDGAVLGTTQPSATTLEGIPFTIRLNKAAVDGLRSMVP